MQTNNDFYIGATVSVKPSAAVINEFMRNGWTQETVEHALSSNKWKEQEGYEESPLQEYKQGSGYIFDWGHVIEGYSSPLEDSPCHVMSWDFCLDEALNKAHSQDMCLHEFSNLCEEFLSGLNQKNWPIIVTDGGSMSSFCLYFQTLDVTDNPSAQIDNARHWGAVEFLEKILPELLVFLDERIHGGIHTLGS